MFIVAVCSTQGGAGKTTLAANLATVLALSGMPTLAVEWDPANVLGFQLGLADPPKEGWVPRSPDDGTQSGCSHRNSDSVEFLTFGDLPRPELSRFEHLLAGNALWLSQCLREIELPDPSVVLIDTARAPSVYFDQAVRAADLILAVLTTDPAFASQVSAMDSRVAEIRNPSAPGPPTFFILNRLDTSRHLSRDIFTIMRSRLQHRLLRYVIHQDESVPEAVASNLSLATYAPGGQAAHDFRGVASWLVARASAASIAPA